MSLKNITPKNKLELQKLKPLSLGAKIGIIAPGSPAKEELVQNGCRALRDKGFEVISPFDPSSRFLDLGRGFFSASASDRAAAFMSLIEDESIEAIIAVRGGYGSAEILPLLDFQKIREARKPIAGYSDVTVLLAAITSLSGIPSIHGATLANELACMEKDDEALQSSESLLQLISFNDYLPEFELEVFSNDFQEPVEGEVLAGNLSMLQTLIGTPWDISYDNKIILLEEIGEVPYRVHRILNHLKQAGKFEKAKALVFGRFSNCSSEHGPNVEVVFEEVFKNTKLSLAKGLNFGHNGLNLALPLGCKARLEKDKLVLLESPLEISN